MLQQSLLKALSFILNLLFLQFFKGADEPITYLSEEMSESLDYYTDETYRKEESTYRSEKSTTSPMELGDVVTVYKNTTPKAPLVQVRSCLGFPTSYYILIVVRY